MRRIVIEARAARSSGVFVGRDGELAVVRADLDEAQAGRGSMFLFASMDGGPVERRAGSRLRVAEDPPWPGLCGWRAAGAAGALHDGHGEASSTDPGGGGAPLTLARRTPVSLGRRFCSAEGVRVRFTVLSDDGERLGAVSFEDGRFDAGDLPNEAVADRIVERFAELRSSGDYDDLERLIRATLERVSTDTGARFVREPGD